MNVRILTYPKFFKTIVTDWLSLQPLHPQIIFSETSLLVNSLRWRNGGPSEINGQCQKQLKNLRSTVVGCSKCFSEDFQLLAPFLIQSWIHYWITAACYTFALLGVKRLACIQTDCPPSQLQGSTPVASAVVPAGVLNTGTMQEKS